MGGMEASHQTTCTVHICNLRLAFVILPPPGPSVTQPTHLQMRFSRGVAWSRRPAHGGTMNAFLKQKAREFWMGLSIEERRALAAPLLVSAGVAPAASAAAEAPAVQPARSRAKANSRILPIAVVADDSVVAVRAARSSARPAPSVPVAVASTASVAAAAATCSDARTSLAQNRRPPPALAGRPSTRRRVLQEVRPMMLVRTCSQSSLRLSNLSM